MDTSALCQAIFCDLGKRTVEVSISKNIGPAIFKCKTLLPLIYEPPAAIAAGGHEKLASFNL